MDGESPLRLARAGIDAIVSEVRRYGRSAPRGVETGGFLVGEASHSEVIAVVAMAGERGIERSRGVFRISAAAIDMLFEWADKHALRIPAQFHSHEMGGVLSDIDRREGFNVRGFISCVVPEYREPPQDANRWGWWRFDGGRWLTAGPAVAMAGQIAVVTFDEDSVREHG